jgi:dipeptidyl aminopeptidase/acylaminoacyl peptidase
MLCAMRRARLFVLGVCLALAGGAASARDDVPAGRAAFFLRGDDGVYLAVESLGAGDTRVLRVPGTKPKDGVGALAFTPDGFSVSFFAGRSYYIVDPGAMQISRRLTPKQLGRGVRFASRSSNGRSVAFVHKVVDPHSSCRGPSWISVMGGNGKSRRLKVLPPVVHETPKRTTSVSDASWSPDGRFLTYTVSRYDDPGDCRLNEYGSGFLFRIRVDGRGKIVQLRRTSWLIGDSRWSADASSVAFQEGGVERSDVFVVRASGGSVRRVTRFRQDGASRFVRYLWKDASSIVATESIFAGDLSESAELYEIDVASGSARRIAGFPHTAALYALSPDGTFAAVDGDENEIAIVSLADGRVALRTVLESPRIDLHRGEFDSDVAVVLTN